MIILKRTPATAAGLAKKTADCFKKSIYPSLSPGVKKRRTALTTVIGELLQDYRSCQTWAGGERGKFKLPRW